MAAQMLGRAQGEQPIEEIPHWHHRRHAGNRQVERPLLPSRLQDRGGSAALGRLLGCPHSAPPCRPGGSSLSSRHRPAPRPLSLGAVPTAVARCLTYHNASSKQNGALERPPWETSNARPRRHHLSRAAPAANQRASLSEVTRRPAGSAPAPQARGGSHEHHWGSGRRAVASLRQGGAPDGLFLFAAIQAEAWRIRGAPCCPSTTKSISGNHLHVKLQSQLSSTHLVWENTWLSMFHPHQATNMVS